MVPTQINDFQERAKKLLIYFFQTKKNIVAILDAVIRQFQDLENAIFDCLNNRYLDDAVGVQLDQIGVIIGEDRQARDDETYRLALQIRILINIAQGERSIILQVFKLLTGSTVIRVERLYPAKLYIQGNGALVPPNLYSTMLEVIAEGVGLILTTSGGDIPFAFDDAPNTAGFGAIGFPDIGGHFVGLLT